MIQQIPSTQEQREEIMGTFVEEVTRALDKALATGRVSRWEMLGVYFVLTNNAASKLGLDCKAVMYSRQT